MTIQHTTECNPAQWRYTGEEENHKSSFCAVLLKSARKNLYLVANNLSLLASLNTIHTSAYLHLAQLHGLFLQSSVEIWIAIPAHNDLNVESVTP